MKKFLAITLAFTLCLSSVLFVGCSKKEVKDFDVHEILATITEENPVSMPGDITDEYMHDFLGITEDMYDDYAGQLCMNSFNGDFVLIVKAKADKVDEVKTALENKKADMMNINYPATYDKVSGGRIVVKDNYVMLVILGDMDILAESGIDVMYEPVDKAIEKAFE